MSKDGSNALLSRLPDVRGRLAADAPLDGITWFRVGGPAEVLFTPADEDDLVAFLTALDPEIPVLTIEDLGVLRDVVIDEDGTVVVTITPTYSGCPAMQLIEDQIALTLDVEGIENYRIETVFSPAWTTDWMSDEAKEKLRSVGIAPPGEAGGIDVGPPLGGKVPAASEAKPEVGGLRLQPVLCPRCSSDDTRTVSEFGSTACKALMVCESCKEPFDLFKRI